MFRPKSAPSLKTRMSLKVQQSQLNRHKSQVNYLTLSNLASGNAVKTQTWNAETTLQSSLNRLGGKSGHPKDRKPLSQLSPLYKAVRRSKTNFKNRDVPVRRKRKNKAKTKASIRHDSSRYQHKNTLLTVSKKKQHNSRINSKQNFTGVISNRKQKQFRSDSLQIEIEFQEKLRVLKEQAKHDRFGQQHKHLPQNIMSSGFYSKIFRLHEEYFGKICESDLSYGSILKLIKAEYDKQFKLAGRTDYGSSIIDSYTNEINTLKESLEKEKETNKTLENEIARLKETIMQQDHTKTLTPPSTNNVNDDIQQPQHVKGRIPYNDSPTSFPFRSSHKTPISQMKHYSGNNGSPIRSVGHGGSSVIDSSSTAKKVQAASPTELQELREEVKLLRSVLAEQNPKLWKELFASRSTASTNSVISLVAAEPEKILYKDLNMDTSVVKREDSLNGQNENLLQTPPIPELKQVAFGSSCNVNNNKNDSLSHEHLKIHQRFTSNQLGHKNHSWENIGEVEGSRLGVAVGGTKYKSTTLRNIPEGQSIASHCSSLPLTNIPEEEYLSETSRSMMTDRSIRSVLSDASSMALSPRLSFGKDLAKPSEVPSLELTRLDEFQTSDSDMDSESEKGTD